MLSLCEAEIIGKSFIFNSMSPNEIIEFCNSGVCERKSFSKGETIYGTDKTKSKLGIILKGRATAICDSDKNTSLKTFSSPDIFGAASVFCKESAEPFSRINAAGKCEVLFITREGIESLLSQNFDRAVSYICFLSDRVAFLNRRISTFTGGEAVERLAEYIFKNADEKGVCENVNFSRLAGALDISRASLYRARNTLCEQGIITVCKRNIKIVKGCM